MDVRSCQGAGTISREATVRERRSRPQSIARSPERAQESCAFLLTLTYIDAGYSPATCALQHDVVEVAINPLDTHCPSESKKRNSLKNCPSPRLNYPICRGDYNEGVLL